MNDSIIEEILSSDNSYILHGPGGTGKSYLIKELAKVAKERCINIARTATTGVSAIGIEGTTINHFAGIGVADKPSEYYVAMLKKGSNYSVIKQTELLVIDEISMMGKTTFEVLNKVLQGVRKDGSPMGGLRVIFSGDFCQLPPVKDEWIFMSEFWWELKLIPIKMETPKRFTDNSYFELLLRARLGKLNGDDIKLLESRVVGKEGAEKALNENAEASVMPTILYARRADVDSYNNQKLEELEGAPMEYIAKDTFTGKSPNEIYCRNLLDNAIGYRVVLKLGAQVMLRANISIPLGLVNGTRGVVVALEKESVDIMLASGLVVTIGKHKWEIETGKESATRMQIPLILAWALTIHKTQGATIDKVICDVDQKIFAPGQAYVLLSRVRCADGLFLRTFDKNVIRADPIIPKFLEQMKLI